MIRYIKDLALFLFIFVMINDMVSTKLVGDSIVKITFGLFIVTHIEELYEMFRTYSNIVMKRFHLFLFIMVVVTLISYLVLFDAMYMDNYLQVAFMRLVSFLIVFTYITYTDQFEKLLYMIWFALMVSSVISYFSDPIERWTFRKTGGTENPNGFAYQLLIGYFSAFYLYTKNKSKIFIIITTLLFGYAFIYAGSRTAFLILGFSLVIIFIFRFRYIWTFLLSTKGILSIFLTIAISVGAVNYLQKDEAISGMQSRATERGGGTMQQRFIIWEAGTDIIRENFFLGIGFAQFKEVSEEYINDFLPKVALPAHNNFIKIFAESGVFAFVAFMLFLGTLFFTNTKRVLNSDYLYIYLASLSSVLMGMAGSTIHHKDFWLSLGLLSHAIYITQKEEAEESELENYAEETAIA
jgi:O-antigen ligase